MQTELGRWPGFVDSERWLARQLRTRLRSLADGASPLNSLRLRVFPRTPLPQYLVTLPDRSRYADYTRVPMPDFYFARVMRDLGMRESIARRTTYAELEQLLRRRIERQGPQLERSAAYLDSVLRLRQLAAQIRDRGGRVLFVRFPSSGMIRMLEERRFPRDRFWDELARHVDAPALHFDDVPALRDFTCPDGSHLDMRDRARFSAALAGALGIGARQPAAPAP
jgi:hypothetical protein